MLSRPIGVARVVFALVTVAVLASACTSADGSGVVAVSAVSTIHVNPGPVVTSLPPDESFGPPVPSVPARGGLTTASNGGSLVLQIGQQRTLHLDPLGALGSYDPIESSQSGVVTLSQTGGYPAATAVAATVTGNAAGTTELSTQSDLACLHAALPCLPPQTGWTLKVTVHD